MNDRFLIYGLVDPTSGHLRYVGKSSYGLKRARSHLYPAALKRDRSYCGNWIRSLLKKGLVYKIVILQAFLDSEVLVQAECFWISYFRDLGCPLTNLTSGGEGCSGREVSPETREKLRLANLGNKNSAGKPRNLSDEQRAQFAARARQRSADPLIREKISKTLTGRINGPRSLEFRQRLSRMFKGRPGMPGSGRPRGSFKKVVVDKDGNIYHGLQEAAQALGVTSSHLCHILAGRRTNNLGIKESPCP